MEELLKAAFAPGVTPREFFFDHLPGLHAARQEQFNKNCKVPLILSLWFGDTDNRYTVELRSDGCEIEEGDMIDFPVATIRGQESRWEKVKPRLLEALLVASANEEKFEKKYGERVLTSTIVEAFEAQRGVIEVIIDTADGPIDLDVILNDYEPESGADRFKVELGEELVEKMARGEVEPRAAVGQIKISGQRKPALQLGGAFAKHFDV